MEDDGDDGGRSGGSDGSGSPNTETDAPEDDRPAEPVDVTAFGAVGDGEADDGPALQTALDAVADRGGGTVSLPPGTYRHRRSLLYGSNLVVAGHGATLLFDPPDPDATALVPRSYGGGDPVRHVVVDGLTLTTADPARGNGIGVAHAEDVTVRDCRGERLRWHLVDVAGGKDVLVRNCYAVGLRSAAYQADNLTEYGGLVVAPPEGPVENAVVDGSANENVAIVHNVAEDCTRGVHLHRSGGHDLSVEQNKIRRCTDVGILGDDGTDWHDVRVSGNIVEGTPTSTGIRLDGRYRNISVENNTVRNHGGDGITVHPGGHGASKEVDSSVDEAVAEGVSVSDNTIERVGGAGIALRRASGEVADNYVYDVGLAGEERGEPRTGDDGSNEGREDGSLVGRPVHEPSGVVVERGDGVTVTDNVCRNVAGVGFVVRGGRNVAVTANELFGFEVGVLAVSDPVPTARIRVAGNTLEGRSESRCGIRLRGGFDHRLDGNDCRRVARGVELLGVRRAFFRDTDVVGDGGDVGYRLDNCEELRFRDNDADGFERATVLSGSSDVEGQLPHADVRVDSDCADVTLMFPGRAPPTEGRFDAGSRIRNVEPSPGGPMGWVCVDGGDPGTWHAFGRIDDDPA
ncbi:right-handed parallel beta-helix repeat-containing protein [Haloprofundus salilacus]|uniref:right-handed parallel beta-helix repeat-containing protein n=1 Tax=Haloprofundus salilacus TaxID=2876190 RepID=UPI001CCE9442|nr:right-handed parallel beta-helix repeat-containing protein [Haloprofundus salilacus]